MSSPFQRHFSGRGTGSLSLVGQPNAGDTRAETPEHLKSMYLDLSTLKSVYSDLSSSVAEAKGSVSKYDIVRHLPLLKLQAASCESGIIRRTMNHQFQIPVKEYHTPLFMLIRTQRTCHIQHSRLMVGEKQVASTHAASALHGLIRGWMLVPFSHELDRKCTVGVWCVV